MKATHADEGSADHANEAQAVRGAPSRCYSMTVAIFARTGMFEEPNPGV